MNALVGMLQSAVHGRSEMHARSSRRRGRGRPLLVLRRSAGAAEPLAHDVGLCGARGGRRGGRPGLAILVDHVGSEQDGSMGDHPPRLVTDEQRERAHVARRRGGLCAWCGRTLGAGEPVHWEHFIVDIHQSVEGRTSHYVTTLEAPVGRECASPAFLREVASHEPGRCAECGRGVYYRVVRRRRRRVACSWLCRDRAGAAERAAKMGAGQ